MSRGSPLEWTDLMSMAAMPSLPFLLCLSFFFLSDRSMSEPDLAESEPPMDQELECRVSMSLDSSSSESAFDLALLARTLWGR